MDQSEIARRFSALTTANLADACLRASVQVRCAPPGTRPVQAGVRLAGRALPVRHAGSVDIFLEAFEHASPGDVLVIDNNGRADEACVGDLVVLEAQAAGVAGVVIWGLHRDTADIVAIGLPVFSIGAFPSGPRRLDPRPDDALTRAEIGDWTTSSEDLVFADDDGVLLVPATRAAEVLAIAETIRDTERAQADRIRSGVTLRTQLRFGTFLQRRSERDDLTFRDYLRTIGGAIEE